MKRILLILVALSLMLMAINSADAQGGKALGLGGMTAISRGVESIYWNPANLAFKVPTRSDFEMVVYSAFGKGGNNSFSINDINRYVGDGESIFLTEEDIEYILSQIPKSGVVFDLEADASILSFRYKNLGFGIESQVYGKFFVPKDLYEDMLYKGIVGNDIYDYSVEGGAQGLVKFKFSYGGRLIDRVIFEVPGLKNTVFKEIAWGASFSLIQGIGYANVEKGSAKLSISENGILPHAEFEKKKAARGNGIGLDLGISAYTNNSWLIGMTVENLIGAVFWNKDVQLETASFDFGDKPLFLMGAGQLSKINMDTVSTDTIFALPAFSKRIPLNFRVGVAKQVRNYLINAEFSHVAGISQFVIGGLARFSSIYLFASVGRRLNNFQWSAGAALDFNSFYIDFGVSTRGGLTLPTSKALSFGTGMRIGL